MKLTIDVPPSAVTDRLVRSLTATTGTLNSSKFKRHKRGTLLFCGASGVNGRITLEWRPAITYTIAYTTCPGCKRRKLRVYDYANHARLVKQLRRLADQAIDG